MKCIYILRYSPNSPGLRSYYTEIPNFFENDGCSAIGMCISRSRLSCIVRKLDETIVMLKELCYIRLVGYFTNFAWPLDHPPTM